ncbi:MAG: DsbC family protein [Nitrospirota bacterium]|nr:DsbC family protein [Nitrospirota bacterium]
MKKYLIIGLFIVLFYAPEGALPTKAFALGGCEEDCMKCHTMSTQDVQQILAKLGAPEAKPLDIKVSAVKGLWEVIIEDRGTKGVMYIGFSKRHVIAGPVFEVDTGMNKTQETFERVNRDLVRYVDYAKIPLDKSLIIGQKNAQYKVVVFTDPDCPYCAKVHEEIKKVVAERKDIAFYIKLMPLPMHPDAFWKSQSMLCMNSVQLLEDNFAKKEIPKPDCDNKLEIEANIKLASELGITGTPTLVFPDGMVAIGGKDAKAIIDLVTNPLKKEASK